MKYFVSLTATLLLCISAIAQTSGDGNITFKVTDQQHHPIDNASVSLLSAKDSSLYKTMIPDKDGLIEFSFVKAGEYLLKSSAVSFEDQYSKMIEITNANSSIVLPDMVLIPNRSAQLKEVTVIARKPFIQKLTDRIVVNVDNSIVSAGSSAMDVLERSPGVNIDQNDVISLRGKQGVIIMIDGKPTPMTGADLANYLQGLPSSAIERIDIITNPSAKYDAAGNSGIIDIQMKKDQRMGANGTFTAGYGQGVYPKANAGSTFNYRNKKINIFGNYNYAYRVGLESLVARQEFL